MSQTVVHETNVPGVPMNRGKVRDVYDLGDQLVIVATDRISAFDCVLPDGIPNKGRVLTALSRFWFERFAGTTPHHLKYVIDGKAPPPFDRHLAEVRGRAMVCVKTEVVPIECVARGYLAGSGWKEYRECGTVCGIKLPAGLRQCDRLPEPIFTPATKASQGHDENIPFERACELVGADLMRTLRDRTLSLYHQAAEYALSRGIIIADTKFEFGRTGGGVLLIDEVFTPDSSRFWPADRYEPGRDQESYDKQIVRDYLQTLCDAGQWDKSPPAPRLTPEVVARTSARYVEAHERITGRALPQ